MTDTQTDQLPRRDVAYLMVTRNPDAYDKETVKRAALWILGSTRVSDEDIKQAASLL